MKVSRLWPPSCNKRVIQLLSISFARLSIFFGSYQYQSYQKKRKTCSNAMVVLEVSLAEWNRRKKTNIFAEVREWVFSSANLNVFFEARGRCSTLSLVPLRLDFSVASDIAHAARDSHFSLNSVWVATRDRPRLVKHSFKTRTETISRIVIKWCEWNSSSLDFHRNTKKWLTDPREISFCYFFYRAGKSFRLEIVFHLSIDAVDRWRFSLSVSGKVLEINWISDVESKTNKNRLSESDRWISS